MKNLKFTGIALLFAFSILFNSCKKEITPRDYVLRGPVFGTSYKITYLNATANHQEAINSIFDVMNNSLSTYIADSDISKINAGDTSILIDENFKEVFTKSKRIFNETEGYFDPTVGNLVNAYGFGPKDEKKNLTADEVKNYMEFVGLNKVEVKNGKIRKLHPNIFLDFNSIAKGFGIDLIARFFDDNNVDNYLIEIGGEIRAKGKKNNGKPWYIKLVNPVDVVNGFKTIDLSNKSMATSGNYRKYRNTEDGRKYVHTVNPKTGFATESNLLSASVIGNVDCADVDAYATAFMAMGLEKTKAFLAKYPHLKVILIYINEDGELSEYSTYQ